MNWSLAGMVWGLLAAARSILRLHLRSSRQAQEQGGEIYTSQSLVAAWCLLCAIFVLAPSNALAQRGSKSAPVTLEVHLVVACGAPNANRPIRGKGNIGTVC